MGAVDDDSSALDDYLRTREWHSGALEGLPYAPAPHGRDYQVSTPGDGAEICGKQHDSLSDQEQKQPSDQQQQSLASVVKADGDVGDGGFDLDSSQDSTPGPRV